jgi:hypothetical protein
MIFAGSMVVEAPVRAVNPQTPATTSRTRTLTIRVLRDFFIIRLRRTFGVTGM